MVVMKIFNCKNNQYIYTFGYVFNDRICITIFSLTLCVWSSILISYESEDIYQYLLTCGSAIISPRHVKWSLGSNNIEAFKMWSVGIHNVTTYNVMACTDATWSFVRGRVLEKISG